MYAIKRVAGGRMSWITRLPGVLRLYGERLRDRGRVDQRMPQAQRDREFVFAHAAAALRALWRTLRARASVTP